MTETDGLELLFAIGGILGFIFFIFLIILWIVLPFLIMGTNKRLDRIIRILQENVYEQKETSKHFEKFISDIDE